MLDYPQRLKVVNKGKRGRGSMAPVLVKRFEELGGNQYYKVEVFTLDNYVNNCPLRVPDFIKIDTEGFEYQCLLGAEQLIIKHRPDLHIEMHGPTEEAKTANAQRVVNFLSSKGYQLYNVQQERAVDPTSYQLAARGHIYCHST